MNYYTLCKPFLDVALLRATPQDIPASQLLLSVVLLANFLVNAIAYALLYDLGPSIVLAVSELALMAGAITALLFVNRKPQRIVQSLAAMSGASTVLTFISLPVQEWIYSAAAAETLSSIHALAWITLMAWSVTITTHIFRHALSSMMTVGLTLAILYTWLVMSVMSAMLQFLGLE